MMDVEKINDAIAEYKKLFSARWENEKIKWEAIKCFHDNWDIDAEDFGKMFKKATDKTGYLLDTNKVFPKSEIIGFAQAEDNVVREMFRNLFNENLDLKERIESFVLSARKLRKELNEINQNDKRCYQNTNATSIYLWLMYPDKYYIYQYTYFKTGAMLFKSDYFPKADGKADNVINGFKWYDEIRAILQSDHEIRKMLDGVLTDSCYDDPELITATIDFGYFVATCYCKQENQPEEDNKPENDTTETSENTSDAPQYWTYAPGENASMWDEFYEKGIMGIRWKALDDLRIYKNREEIKSKFQHYYRTDKLYTNQTLGAWQFSREMKNGDIVFVKKGVSKIVGCGIVTSNYFYDDTQNAFKHVRKIKWLRKGEWDLTEQVAQKTLTNVTTLTNFVQQLLKLLNLQENTNAVQENIEADTEEPIPYTKQNFLEEVFMTAPHYDALLSLLRCKKNIILQGAPGVGKTFTAKRLAYSVMGERDDSRIRFVQFHQSYSYEDFIMGYRPNENGGFELKNGIFYEFCNRARRDSGRDYFFIIDEINRGNMSKIFGELLMLIEKDYRGEKAVLSYSGEEFFVPGNLYIIGMMNTADRSLAMIDYALRRRFGFYTIPPAFENAQENGFEDLMDGTGCELYRNVVAKIRELNDAIRKDNALGRGFEIGHSYFVPKDLSIINDAWVRNVVRFEIIPLIEEYWFEDEDKCKTWKEALYQTIGEKDDV